MQFIGLWGVWWGGSDPTGTPDGVKVVLATAPSAAGAAATTTLAATRPNGLPGLPWVVLQLQSLDENDPPWAGVLEALRPEIEARRAADAGGASSCAGRLTYDNKQLNHAWSDVARPDVLSGYAIRRLERGSPSAHPAQPATAVNRERIEYRSCPAQPSRAEHAPRCSMAQQASRSSLWTSTSGWNTDSPSTSRWGSASRRSRGSSATVICSPL